MQVDTAQKMKFSIKDFFSKCDQIRSFLRIWSHLLKKSVMENFIFYAVSHSSTVSSKKKYHPDARAETKAFFILVLQQIFNYYLSCYIWYS